MGATDRGYELAALRQGLRPLRLHWFARLRSTSDRAAAMRRRGGLFAPAVVVSSRQTAGRGRGDNRWWSDGRCLTATFVFPAEEHLASHQVALAAGLAVRHAAAELCPGCRVGLKWPNDVLYEGRKLSGLLCERVEGADLIGVGLNVNVTVADMPAALRRQATSLAAMGGRPLNMNRVLCCVARHLQAMLLCRQGSPFGAILREYEQYDALRGRRISVDLGDGQGPVCGMCSGLDNIGRLLVGQGRKQRAIIAGQVRLM